MVIDAWNPIVFHGRFLLFGVFASVALYFDNKMQQVAIAMTVIDQDGRVCELNQRGLKNRPHRQGVLVPQERYVAEFHDWLRERLGTD